MFKPAPLLVTMLTLMCLAAGCDDAGGPAAADQGAADQGAVDQGVVDQGVPDQGAVDQGVPDQGAVDQGVPDQGAVDQGVVDQGVPDQGVVDQGVADARVPVCEGEMQRCGVEGEVIEICVEGAWRPISRCPAQQVCADGLCVDAACEPDCAGKACGSDGCGASCGVCGEDTFCADGQCEPIPAECGDGVCNGEEACGTCSADCGQCCGDGLCDGDAGESCATCLADCGCEPAEICNAVERQCEQCVPQCEGRQCGDDGCGGQCGGCPEAVDCVAGLCDVPCEPRCDGRECGDDTCGGGCGDCADGELCSEAGRCAAPPPACGDGVCADEEDCATCPADCGTCCGDGECVGAETCATCPADCGCEIGQRCAVGQNECVEICVPQCDGRQCGDDGCGAVCGDCLPDAECVQGACVEICVPNCAGMACGADGCGGVCGQCGQDEICDAGSCELEQVFCDCAPGEACLDGICREPGQLCSEENPVGLCGMAFGCVGGECVDRGAGCSLANPTGVCQLGEICEEGACVVFDGAALCDDGNACTADAFDYAQNRCVHAAQAGPCDDGNACTLNVCEAGVCAAAALDGCLEPPSLDPFDSPTNVNSLTLSGTKSAGASIQINGQEAAPESPGERWSVELNLAPGVNVFEVLALDRGEQSAAVVARVVYDIDRPTVTFSPNGGQFLQGVTVTVVSSEPATVYYSLDGTQPDEWSRSFRSVKRFRIFDDTRLRVRALDDAGNWNSGNSIADFEITGDGNRWTDDVAALPEALTLMGVAQMNGQIYVVGGSDGLAIQAGVHSYDPVAQAWTVLADLPIARASLSAVVWDGRVYAIGGENQGLPLNLTQRLAPGEDAWENLAPMPSTRFGLAAAVSGDLIYAFGGKTNGGLVLPNVEIYDPAADAWTNQVAQMPRPRYGHSATAHGGLIYLIGGEDRAGVPIAAVDIYDPSTDVWREGPALPTPRSFAMAEVYRNIGRLTGGVEQIVVFGGRLAGGASTAVVEALQLGEIDAERWVERTPMSQPRHSGGAARIEADAGPDGALQLWAIGGAGAELLTASMGYYTQDEDYTRTMAPLPEGRFQHSAQTADSAIYLFGGRDLVETTAFWRFDPETQTYTTLADLPSVQRGLVGAVVDDRIYAIGGANGFNLAVPFTRVFDPATGVWSERAPMQSARSEAAVAVLKDEIWVLGGENNGALQSVEIYDVKTDTWRPGPVLPAGRRGAMAAAHRGEIVLVGGLDAQGQLIEEALVLRDGAWVDPGFGVQRSHGVALRTSRDQLVIFGGRGPGGLEDGVWSVNLANRRTLAASKPADRQTVALDFAAATVLGGDIYLLGGNSAVEPGPPGETLVQKLRLGCFNGVRDGFEAVTDHGGRCTRDNVVHFSGVQNNVNPARLEDWRMCYRGGFTAEIPIIRIRGLCTGARLITACRRVGTANWLVLAEASQEEVFRLSAGHDANGVRWYNVPGRGIGFGPVGEDAVLELCDTNRNGAAQRMCWRTSGRDLLGGDRCGGVLGANRSYERAVFSTDSLP